jgi:hypothetical protein
MAHQVVGLLGWIESGKSTMLRKLLRKAPRIVVFDPNDEHGWVPNEVRDPDELDGFFAQVRGKNTFAVRYIPESEGDDELAKEFSEVSRSVFAQGDLCFAVEEIPLLAGAGHMPGAFARVVRQGRHQGVHVLWSGQRAAEVPRTLTAQTRLFFLFAQYETLDLKALGERCGPEVEDRVSKLGLHGMICFDVASRRIIPEEEAIRIFAAGVQTNPIPSDEDGVESQREPWWKRRFVIGG